MSPKTEEKNVMKAFAMSPIELFVDEILSGEMVFKNRFWIKSTSTLSPARLTITPWPNYGQSLLNSVLPVKLENQIIA